MRQILVLTQLWENFLDFVAGESVKQHFNKQLRLLIQSDFRNCVLL
jgi:hypothetical protein